MMEVGYRGTAPSGSVAAGRPDLLNSVVHELGHELGINFDTQDYDVGPHFIGGIEDVDIDSTGMHITPRSALMCFGCAGLGVRRLPSATDIFAIADDQGFDEVDLARQDILPNRTNFNDPASWFGGSVPDGGDAFIRNGPASNVELSANRTVGNLWLDNGNKLTISALLTVNNNTTVQGASTLLVGRFESFVTNGLTVNGVSTVSLASDSQVTANNTTTIGQGSTLVVGGSLVSDVLTVGGKVDLRGGSVQVGNASLLTSGGTVGTLTGLGDVTVTGGLTNTGVIAPTGLITITGSPMLAVLDLDGGGGRGVLNALGGDLVINGLVSGFAGQIQIGAGHQVTFNDGWSLLGQLKLQGGPVVSAAATLGGGTFAGNQHAQIQGDVYVSGNSEIVADVEFIGPSVVSLSDAASTLVISGDTRYRGGTLEGRGTLVQNGDVTVSGPTPTTIGDGGMTYDWDGNSRSATTIEPGATLTIRAGAIGITDPAANLYFGTVNVNAGTLSVNVPAASPKPWRLNWVMNLNGSPGNEALVTGRSRLILARFESTINSRGLARIDTPIELTRNSSIIVHSGELTLDRATAYAGGSVSGAGTLRQAGNATVSRNTTINVATFDWDGEEQFPSATTINSGITLAVRADQLDEDPSGPDVYDCTLSVNGGTLEVSVPAARSAAWRLDGAMNLDGEAASEAVVTGDSSLIVQSSGRIFASLSARIDTPIELRTGSRVGVYPGGVLTLAQPTTYAGGTVTGGGTLRQNGDATVNTPTIIEVSTYDWDGDEALPSTTRVELLSGGFFYGPDDGLVINADQIDEGDDGYDGTVTLIGRPLIVNTAGPWRLDGRLELAGLTDLPRVAGSEIVVYGTIDVTDVTGQQAIFEAPVDFRSSAVVALDAGEILHFDNRVTYRGGTFSGDGTIVHNANVIVEDPTTIDVAAIELNGRLTVRDALTVNTAGPWAVSDVALSGAGAIGGAALTVNGKLSGAGTITTAGLVNNGKIVADGGILTLATANFPDLDGAANNRIVDALSGDIHIASSTDATAPFFGTLNIGAGREFSIDRARLRNRGTINLRGTYTASLLRQEGTLNVPAQALQATLSTSSDFLSGSTNTIGSNAELHIAGTALIHNGADFSGDGTLVNDQGSKLCIQDGATVGVTVRNDGEMCGGNSPGSVTVANYIQGPTGTLEIEIGGTTPRSQYDQFNVAGTTTLDGTLEIVLIDGFMPEMDNTFDVFNFGATSGGFSTIVLPALDPGTAWNVSALLTGGSFSVVRSSAMHWASTSGGAWDNPANWDLGVTPGLSHDVYVDPTNGLAVEGPAGSATINALSVGAQTSGTATLVLQNTGTLNVTGQTAITASGKLAGEGTFNGAGGITNEGETDLGENSLQLVGGLLNNRGLIRGSGRIDNELVNWSDGEVRAESGRRILFTGGSNRNSGEINLTGGTVEFTGSLISTGGFISGRGELHVEGGLDNWGKIGFSGGLADVYGDVTHRTADGAEIVVAGGSTTTFYDDVIVDERGSIHVAADGSLVLFGAYNGGTTGTGPVYISGDLRPGSSPGEIAFGGDLLFGPAAEMEIELGGTTPGEEYDRLLVAGELTFGGTLLVELIDGFEPIPGDPFEMISAGSFSGAFDEVQLPALADDLLWNLDFGTGDVTLSVQTVPEPGSLALLALGILAFAAFPLRWRRRAATGPESNV